MLCVSMTWDENVLGFHMQLIIEKKKRRNPDKGANCKIYSLYNM